MDRMPALSSNPPWDALYFFPGLRTGEIGLLNGEVVRMITPSLIRFYTVKFLSLKALF